MQLDEKQLTRELLRRMTSLTISAETLIKYLSSWQKISEQSPLLQSQAAATLELVSLMTAALRVSQYAINRSSWTGGSQELESWREHWHTAYENFETQSNIGFEMEPWDDCGCS